MSLGSVKGARYVFSNRVILCDDGVARDAAEVTELGLGGVLVGNPGTTIPLEKAKQYGLMEPPPEKKKTAKKPAAKPKARKVASNKSRKGSSDKG